ncbi:MAG: hypothetical protein JO122_05720, partial [Acetobacteraceae bacterium]|nr:hypothetical protein [Acetobacteraceae bacterium]
MRPALLALLLLVPLLAGCVAHLDPEGPPVDRAIETTGFFQMPDGTRLPYRVWQPDPAPRAIMVAFHGMNDSRDAWEVPADAFTNAG